MLLGCECQACQGSQDVTDVVKVELAFQAKLHHACCEASKFWQLPAKVAMTKQLPKVKRSDRFSAFALQAMIQRWPAIPHYQYRALPRMRFLARNVRAALRCTIVRSTQQTRQTLQKAHFRVCTTHISRGWVSLCTSTLQCLKTFVLVWTRKGKSTGDIRRSSEKKRRCSHRSCLVSYVPSKHAVLTVLAENCRTSGKRYSLS